MVYIKGGSIFDSVKGSFENNPGIYIEGQTILSVGTKCPEGAKVIDAKGGYILPGLINAHVHLDWDASADPDVVIQNKPDTYVTHLAACEARKHLALGITTVRDTASLGYTVLSLRDAVRDGLIEGPNIVTSGPPIAMTGGHIHRFALIANGADEVRAAARKNLHEKVDFIKLMATGGVYTEGEEPGSAQLTTQEMSAAVEEAHKRCKRVTVHAEGLEGIKNSIRAGTDMIEHFNYADDEAIQMAVERGVYLCPTMICFIRMTGEAAEKIGVPSWAMEKAQRVVDAQRESFPKAVKAGAKIVAGTDAGAPLNVPEDYFEELRLMHKAGMSIVEVLRSATSVAAEAIDLPTVGTIKPGNMADILILGKDPTQNLDNLQTATLIIKSGRTITGC